MKAFLKNYRQAPRKVRLVADSVRGKSVPEADAQLSLMSQKAAPVLRKLVASAVANARQANPSVRPENLYIATITVDKGMTYTRFMPRAFGRASPINRECAHIRLALLLQDGVSEEVVVEREVKKEKNSLPAHKK